MMVGWSKTYSAYFCTPFVSCGFVILLSKFKFLYFARVVPQSLRCRDYWHFSVEFFVPFDTWPEPVRIFYKRNELICINLPVSLLLIQKNEMHPLPPKFHILCNEFPSFIWPLFGRYFHKHGVLDHFWHISCLIGSLSPWIPGGNSLERPPPPHPFDDVSFGKMFAGLNIKK